MRLQSTSRRAVRSVLAFALGLGSTSLVASGCGGGDEACTGINCPTAAPANAGQGGGAGTGGTGVDIFDNSPTGPGSGGSSGFGEACRQVTFSAQTSPVNVHILLDRSTSMNEPADSSMPDGPTRWEAVTGALRAFVMSPQANQARVGLQFFGLMAQDDCAVEKYVTPAVPVEPLPANQQALITAIDNARPISLTPTAPAVAGALQYARQVAELPENAGIPTLMVLASDGIPSECGPTDENGMMIVSFREIISTLQTYSQPPRDAMGNPMRPPVLTYIVGTQELENNAEALAEAGGGQAFLVDGAATGGGDLEQRFLDALLSIVVKPLDCEIDVPQTVPDTGEVIDFDKVRVSFTGAASRIPTEFPRTYGPAGCGVNQAWFYDDPAAPTKIFFCRNACESLGAGDLQLELGCSPRMILQ